MGRKPDQGAVMSDDTFFPATSSRLVNLVARLLPPEER